MSKSLFNEFEPQTAKAWKQKIQVDLKGADYNDTLVWKNREGIDVKPFYHSDDFESHVSDYIPENQSWNIAETLLVNNEKEANEYALNSLSRGAETIVFIISGDVSFGALLKDIDTNRTPVILRCHFLSEKLIEKVSEFGEEVKVQLDIISNLAQSGNWFYNLKEDHSLFEKLVKHTKHISVDLDLYQNASANMTQQLAYTISHLSEYLNHFDRIFTTVEKKKLKISFNVSVGSNYFFEISKLKALRLLYSSLAKVFEINPTCEIIATPSQRNKTIYDYNVNMLRTTSECMSAVLGGADVVSNQRYDSIYHHPNEFGTRIARNQLLILKHESYFNKVTNPSDGAYYIESLTEKLANKALDLFKDIEKNGGFLAQLKSGIIQKKIKESALKEQNDFDQGDLKLVGTNIYQNPQDRMKGDLERYPFFVKNKRKTLIEPILTKRLSENLEQNRLQDE